MVRPRKIDKKIPYTVMLEPKVIKEIKKMAETAQLPAGAFARNLLLIGLDDARLFHKLGFISLLGASRQKIDEIKKRLNIFDPDVDDLTK